MKAVCLITWLYAITIIQDYRVGLIIVKERPLFSYYVKYHRTINHASKALAEVPNKANDFFKFERDQHRVPNYGKEDQCK